jgi:LuxR family quorum sensing-dependent transcriptional regulator
VPVLTPREREVLTWSAIGKTSEDIADILGVSTRTIVAHAVNATAKLGATSRTHAVAKSLALGLIRL